MKLSSPFSESFNVTYEKIGGNKKKKYKSRDIENLIQSKPTSKEEIDLCLNCPYPDCVKYCDRIKKFRKERAKQNGNEKSFTHKTKRNCSACPHRKWIGDYALTICEITGKVIEPYYYCDIKENDEKI